MESFDFMADDAYVRRLNQTKNNGYYKLMATVANEKFLNDKGRKELLKDGKWNTPFALSPNIKEVYKPDFKVQSLPPYSVAITLRLKLTTPLLTSDDTPFYLFDNPVRRDHIFQQPYLSSAALLGLAQDAFRRAYPAGVKVEESTTAYRNEVKQAERIFGIAQDETGMEVDAKKGALKFAPAWFRKVSYEVMNPRDPKTGQGTCPIRFEAIEKGQETNISFLYAPRTFDDDLAFDQVAEDVALLMRALATYWPELGLGAKRLAGYGHFEIMSATFKGKHWALKIEDDAPTQDNAQTKGVSHTPPEPPRFLKEYLTEEGDLIAEKALQQRINGIKKQADPEVERLKADEDRVKRDKSLSGAEKKAKLKNLKDKRKKASKKAESSNPNQIEAQRDNIRKQYNQCKCYKQAQEDYQQAQEYKISKPLEKSFKGQKSWQELADWLWAVNERGQKG